MKKRILVPVITIPVVSLLAVAFYLIRKAKLSQTELQSEIESIGPEDIQI